MEDRISCSAARNGRQVIQRVVWAGGCQRYLLEVGGDPRLTAPCAQLLHGDAMDHLLCQAHFKRPHDGVMFDWHQDIQHRDKGNGTWTDVNGRGSFVQTIDRARRDDAREWSDAVHAGELEVGTSRLRRPRLTTTRRGGAAAVP